MSDEPHPAQSPLTSWKEIGAHFQKDVRTVQRWERNEGLPVHRHLHRHQASVYAYGSELDSWWLAREGSHHTAPEAPAEPTPPAAAQRRLIRIPLRNAALAIVSLAALAQIASINRGSLEGSNVDRTGEAHAAYWVNDTPGSLIPVTPGDLDDDGRADLAFAAPGANEVYVVLANERRGRGDLREVASTRIAIAENGNASASAPGDVNGDGIPDLSVSVALREPDAFGRTGSTYVLFGRKQWPSRLTIPVDADVTFDVDLSKDVRLGACPGSFDLNGDGINDLLLGGGDFTPTEGISAGAAFVFFGRTRWPARIDVVKNADVRIDGSRKGEGLAPVCACGDWTGDGVSDVALLATESQLWNLLGGRGRVYVFSGRGQWPSRLRAQRDFTLRIDGTRASAVHIEPVIADVNGDGIGDLIVGEAGTYTPPAASGYVNIWLGGTPRAGVLPDRAADVSIEQPEPDARFGAAVLARDVDFDGLQDLIVSEAGTGRIYLFYGRKAWPARGTPAEMGAVTISAGAIGAGFTRLTAGDVDGDGLTELIAAEEAPLLSLRPVARARIMPLYERLAIDVRPEAQPNVIVYPGGTLAVRLRTIRGDAGEIDPATLRAAGANATDYVLRDFDDDGRTELQVYFDNNALHVDDATRALVLTGRTFAGRPLGGVDTVVVHRSGNHVPPNFTPASASGRPRASSLQ